MYKILIDSAERYQKSVKLEKGGEIIAEKTGDIDITASIQEILKENRVKIDEVNEFVANPGPGSFTGLKIGITAANILNWALGKKKISELTYPKYGSEPNIHKTKWIEK